MADDPRVLELVEQYMRRNSMIKAARSLLDSPGRVETANHLLEMVPPKVRRRLDAICDELCNIIKVPMAAVTLVNESEQLFLGACNLGPEPIPRDHSLCMFVAASGQSFELNDLPLKDQQDLPAYFNDGVRAYLGRPLMVHLQTVGSLCVVDRVPREWTELENQLLTNFAAHVSSILEEQG